MILYLNTATDDMHEKYCKDCQLIQQDLHQLITTDWLMVCYLMEDLSDGELFVHFSFSFPDEDLRLLEGDPTDPTRLEGLPCPPDPRLEGLVLPIDGVLLSPPFSTSQR